MNEEFTGSMWDNWSNICPKCGKPYTYVGDPLPEGTPDYLQPYCTCGKEPPSTNLFTSYGWICPKCDRVFSPQTKECPYCNPTYTITSTAFPFKIYFG